MGKNRTFDMEWVRSCPECGEPAIAVPPPKGAAWQCTSCDWEEPDDEWKQLEANAHLGAAVRAWVKAVHYDIDRLKLIARLRRKHSAGDEIAGLYEIIADALEAEAGDVAG